MALSSTATHMLPSWLGAKSCINGVAIGLNFGEKVVRSDLGKKHKFKAKPQKCLKNWKQAATISRREAVQDFWCQYQCHWHRHCQ